MDCNSTHIVSHCWYCNRLQYTMDGMDNHSYRLQWNMAWVLWRYYLLYETTIECSKNAHSIVMVVKSFKKGEILFVNDFLLFTQIKFIFLDFSKIFLLLLLPSYFIALTCYHIMIHEASHILQRFCGVHHQ